MPPEKMARAESILDLFEDRLESVVKRQGIPRRHIRPLFPGSVICGALDDDDTFYVGYLPQLGMPTVSFVKLRQVGSGPPNILSFYNCLIDETGQDFSVVELSGKWLDLDENARSTALEATAIQVVQNEISRAKVQATMMPFNPVFGPNRFPIQENMVFILMPFEERLTSIYNSVVKPTVEAKNLVCRRADDINSNNAIMSDIWKSICESRFVIVDLTSKNPNVMYELGVAHTVGKETILIHQSGGGEKFPFDISHFRIIDYQDTVTGGAALRSKLESTIDSVLQKIQSSSLLHG